MSKRLLQWEPDAKCQHIAMNTIEFFKKNFETNWIN